MVSAEEVKEALKKLAKKKFDEDAKEYVAIKYHELAKALNITPSYALMWLKTVCEEYGKYINGKCVIYESDIEE